MKTSDEFNTNPNPHDLERHWELISKKLMYAHVVGSFEVSNKLIMHSHFLLKSEPNSFSLEHLSLADFSGE